MNIIVNIEKIQIIWISIMDKSINQKQNYDGSIGENQRDEEYKLNNQSPKIKDSGSNYRLKSNK